MITNYISAIQAKIIIITNVPGGKILGGRYGKSNTKVANFLELTKHESSSRIFQNDVANQWY